MNARAHDIPHGQPSQSKVIDATLRLQCLLQAQVLEGRLEAFPNMPPAVRALLDRTAKLLHEVAK